MSELSRQEKLNRLEELKNKAKELKKEADYYNALQLALKLVLNGSYGALAASHFVLFNNNVAGTITAEGRRLTRTMGQRNLDYWRDKWHLDKELHKLLGITDVKEIGKDYIKTSVYSDTDSLFVSLEPALNSCTWKNLVMKQDILDKIKQKHILITPADSSLSPGPNCALHIDYNSTIEMDRYDFAQLEIIDVISKDEYKDLPIVCDGEWISVGSIFKTLRERKVKWNWSRELDIIHAIDKYRYADYFVKCLEEHAEEYGIENKQDFELERISEAQIHIAKKKYISHILFEDGIPYDRLKYIYPKGVELIRSSTPLFAREKVVDIVKYLFENSTTFNSKDLLSKVKELRKEFDMCVPDRMDEIAMQTGCNNYNIKVLNDTTDLEFVNATHFGVKAAAHHNYLLHQNPQLLDRYSKIKSGSKIKYYVCKTPLKGVTYFGYERGKFPIEFAPDIDLDTQFQKCILATINGFIKPLGLPEITKRLSVLKGIFGDAFSN